LFEVLRSKIKAVLHMAARSAAASLRSDLSQVVEFIGLAVNAVLYHRAVYPQDRFVQVYKYGQSLPVSTDAETNIYLKHILMDVAQWLANGSMRQFEVVVGDAATGIFLERWKFDFNPCDELPPSVSHQNRGFQEMFLRLAEGSEILPEISQPRFFDVFVHAVSATCSFDPSVWEPTTYAHAQQGRVLTARLHSFSTPHYRLTAAVECCDAAC
jgi:mitotic spindle assembly checkpoint protein MAD2